MLKIVLGVVIVTIIGLIVLQFVDPNINNNFFGTQQTDDPNKINGKEDDDEKGAFSIKGNVVNPGKYLLTMNDTTMSDLINAAGGVTSNADERCYYLEAKLEVNQTYYIPTKFDITDVCGDDEIKKVNINIDNADILQTISGIGNVLSDAIVEYRDVNGLFYTIEALKNVKGVGNSKFEQIKDYVILHE